MSVTVTASRSYSLGPIGTTFWGAPPRWMPFDAGAAGDAPGGLLVVVLHWTPNWPLDGPQDLPLLTYGGLPLVPLPEPHVYDTVNFSQAAVWVLSAPPAGRQRLVVAPPDGVSWVGQALVQATALMGATGRLGFRAGLYSGDFSATLDVPAPAAGALQMVYVSTIWTVPRLLRVAAGAGAPIGLARNPYGLCFQAPRGAGGDLEIVTWPVGADETIPWVTGSWVHMTIVVLEILGSAPAGDVTGTLEKDAPGLVRQSGQAAAFTPAPDGQTIAVYWNSWYDVPDVAGTPEPADFLLANIPRSVQVVLLAFASPRASYVDLDSDLRETLAFDWQWSAALLRDTIALLRARNPGVEVLLSIQQYTGLNDYDPEPYSPDGWGGMTLANRQSLKAFVDDMGLDGIDIDYEVVSEDLSVESHCWTNPDGTRSCYHDAELLSVIQDLRATFPRPDYLLTAAAFHVGAYGEGIYADALPVGWNNGYWLAVAKNPTVRQMLDRLYLMAYDAGPTYDPRVALAAFEAAFPEVPLWLGLNTGPADWYEAGGNPKRSLREARDYNNHVMLRGQGGTFVYSLQWGVIEDEFHYAPSAQDPNCDLY